MSDDLTAAVARLRYWAARDDVGRGGEYNTAGAAVDVEAVCAALEQAQQEIARLRERIAHNADELETALTMRRTALGGLTYLECPCCGDEGAASDGEGGFVDGQPLICGCPGWVSVDEDDDPWITNGDAPCPRCTAPETSPMTAEERMAQAQQELERLLSVSCDPVAAEWQRKAGAADAEALARTLARALHEATDWLREPLSPCDEGCDCARHHVRAVLALPAVQALLQNNA